MPGAHQATNNLGPTPIGARCYEKEGMQCELTDLAKYLNEYKGKSEGPFTNCGGVDGNGVTDRCEPTSDMCPGLLHFRWQSREVQRSRVPGRGRRASRPGVGLRR
jgi:hypothetical protein